MTANRSDSSSGEDEAQEKCTDSAARARPPDNVVAGAIEHFLHLARAADWSPRVLLDDESRILWRSPTAEDLLQPPMPLSIKGGRMQVMAGAGTKGWPSFLENVGAEGGRLLLNGQTAGTWILVRAWAERFGEHRLVFLKCALSWPFRDVASSGLAQDFGLTRSESAVLDEFARLAKPNQIAERLNISVSTVRSHLKQIHTKMSVNSGVHLLRITRAYTDT